MIEQAMIFALGLFTAGLLALAVAPAFWRRAERLSIRRLEMLMPLSPREVSAERDALRADFAVEARRRERVLEEHVATVAAAQAELGREKVAAFALNASLTTLRAAHDERGADLDGVRRDLAIAEAGAAATEKALHDADALAADRQARLAARELELAEVERLAEERRASTLAAEARIAGLAAHVESTDRAHTSLLADLQTRRDESERLSSTLAAAEARIATLERQMEDADAAHEALEEALRRQSTAAAEGAEKGTGTDRLETAGESDDDGAASAGKAWRMKAEAGAHALIEARAEIDRLRRLGQARGAAELASIDDLDDPRLRDAIHGIGTTIARLAAAQSPAARERGPA